MRFPYHEVDEIEPDSSQQIQVRPGSNHYNINSPTMPLFQSTPLYLGIMQIVAGLVAAGLGAAEVFLVPVLIDPEHKISFNHFNCYGASIWSGFLLVLAGSCAIRAHIKQDKTEAMRLYGVSLFVFLGVLALLIFTLVCYTKWWTNLEDSEKYYYIYSLLGTISSLVGLMVLTISLYKYFTSVMFGNVRMVESFILCCFPCCSKKNSEESLA